MNLIPHVKGAEEAFGIGYLYELRITMGSIADELAAEILCDWALVSASKELDSEQSRFEFAHDQERRASDEAIINVTADYNVSSIFSIGRAAPHRFFEPSVRKPLSFECFVKGARAGGDTIEGLENLLYNTRGVGVWRAWRGRDEESAIDALWQAICLNECLCKVNAVKFQILCSRNGDDGLSGCTALCGAEGVVVVNVLLHFEALYDEARFESRHLTVT